MKRLALVLACAASVASAKDLPKKLACAGATCSTYATPEAAFSAVVAKKPRILGVGEYHQQDGSKIPSALKRFTETLLPKLRGLASELVVETWILDGKCGDTEKQVAAEVKVETHRPAETENEVVTLGKRAKQLGIAPSAVNLTCAEYASVLAPDGTLDPETLLTLIAKLLSKNALRISNEHHAAGDDRVVAIYGGALHNDLAPDPAIAEFSFGQALSEATKGRYVELDLYVPEYVADDEDVTHQPWYPAVSKKVRGNRTLLVERAPNAFVIVFPETPAPAKKKT